MQNKNEYLDTVCNQIRFIAARKTLRQELETHIDDKTEELLGQGENNAEQKAVAAMGDAVQTGKALNAIHRPRMEWIMMACVLLMSTLCYVITHFMAGYIESWPLWVMFKEMLKPMVLGLILMAVMTFMDYALLKHLRYVLYAMAIINIVVYFLTLYRGDTRGGGEWLSQISVIIISTFMFIISLIELMSYSWKNRYVGLLIIFILSTVSVVMMYKVSYEYALLLALTNIVVFTASRWERKHWPVMTAFACLMIAAYILTTRNFFSYNLDVFVDASGHDPDVANILKTAHFIGPSAYYTQEATRMFLFGTRTYYLISAIIGAYGWLAGLGVAFVSCMIGVLMLRRAMIIPHTYGRLLAVGIGAYFLIRFLLNLLVNMNVIAGSFNLPFISHGRIEYIADTVLMGVYLSVWRRSTFMKDDVKKPLPIKKQAIMVE